MPVSFVFARKEPEVPGLGPGPIEELAQQRLIGRLDRPHLCDVAIAQYDVEFELARVVGHVEDCPTWTVRDLNRPGYDPLMARVTKTVRLAGHAESSIEDAISTVLARAATTIERISTYRVVDIRGDVDAAGLPRGYGVTLDITFEVREGEEGV